MTRKEYFERFLPEDIAKLAIKNTHKNLLSEEIASSLQALRSGFVWSDTPEGHVFWSNHAHQAIKLEEALNML